MQLDSLRNETPVASFLVLVVRGGRLAIMEFMIADVKMISDEEGWEDNSDKSGFVRVEKNSG